MTSSTPKNLRIDARRLTGSRPPVLLVGGINVVRAFGLGGVPVIVATPDASSPAVASKYCAGTCRLPAGDRSEAMAEALLRAGAYFIDIGLGQAPLFCGEDRYLRVLQDFREPLSKLFRLALNDADVGRALIDKSLFQALAEEKDLPVPRRIPWDRLIHFPGPILAKPNSKARGSGGAAYEDFFARDSKARVFGSGAKVRNDPAVAEIAERLIFQEYVPGDDRSIWSFHGFADEHGQLLEWFIGRKIRTHPPLTGESSYLELAYDDEVARLGRAIVARIPLKGFFKIDFKRSADTEKIYMLEVNARCSLWLYLGAANGINLARVAYDYIISRNRPVHATPPRRCRWLCLRRDYLAYRQLASEGRLTALEWLASLLESPKVYSLFAWSDPLPFLHQQWHRVGRFSQRLRRS